MLCQDVNVPFVANAMSRCKHTTRCKCCQDVNVLLVANNNYAKWYNVNQHISIDESMFLFKGRNSLKQYNPMKPIKRGVQNLGMCRHGWLYVKV